MADGSTPNYGLTLPEIGASADNWGDKLNDNFTDIDTAVFACTRKANNLSDLASAATSRTNLGLGTLATLSAVNNAQWSGTALSVGNGGTGATTAATARLALGVGTVGEYNLLPVAVGGTGATDAATARTNLGVAIGSNVQAYSATLTSLASANASGVTIATSASANGASLATAADYAAMKVLLSLGNVENKSSATIRGEMTKANVDTALGKTAARVTSGAATNSGLISWGTGAPGTLDLGEIYLQHA